MKKIALYILVSILINFSFGMISVIQENSSDTDKNFKLILTANAQDPAPAARTYQAPLIDKPSTLPGPTVKQQKESSGDKAASPTQKILSEILLPKATTGIIGFISMISFLMLIISGVRFVTAYGNEENITKAKNQAIYSLVGLVLSLLAYTIVSIIANLNPLSA